MGKRNLYLKTTPVHEALEKYMESMANLIDPKYESIAVTESLHRITRNAVYAKYSSPLFNAAAMDGIAVIAEKTNDASETNPLLLKEDEDFVVVDTGDPIKFPYDAVIMAEDIVMQPDGARIINGAAPWQHVRPIGEDIVAGEMILAGKHKIRPIDIGVLLSGGITEIEVCKKPRVGIFPTGDEIVEAKELLAAGQKQKENKISEGAIIESNSRMFENMVTEAGGIGDRFPTLPDDYEKIKNAIKEAVKDKDIVIINAGSSAGRDDYTVHVLRELGEVLIHGVAIKPGKPVILAKVDDKPVIGLPGYPVSAYIGFENFVLPILSEMTGEGTGNNRRKVQATISKRLISSLKHKEYVRVKVGKVGDRIVAAPLARGAGAAMSLVRADGFCVIPQNSEGVEAGEKIQVELYRDEFEIENTVVIIGSHDLILDIVADMMPNWHRNMFVSSTHVGSMGGLMALKRQEAHLAPIHLLDGETGQYNILVLKQLFAGKNMTLIKGVGRTQGIMIKKGNPLHITGIEDLIAKGECEKATPIRYVNRQRGAGTRILFDYKLRELGIDPIAINGYEREATTHMAVAAAVDSDGADAGMGILSAAKAMNLDFIPIADEEYDFAIPTEYLELPHIKAFLEIIQSEQFKNKLEELGGYTFENTGKLVDLN